MNRKEYLARYREENRERIREQQRQWRLRHTEEEKDRCRKKAVDYRATPDGRGDRLFHGAKKRAATSGIEFSLEREWVIEKVKSGVCEVTGLPFELSSGRSLFAPSLDRTDPTKGYTPDNVKVVVWSYNAAKATGTHEEVLVLAHALVANDN
ncbi:hypothetical protein bb8_p56 [Bordetella phage vB_BbrP_BB8]|uniref:Uncharacterized protein n=1 Tax=Bordetella phage vB_BbrP_BB8 TaxID=2587820 RepID=A0A4Y5TR40_9CAUD|nr:hypothetical protein bb8_p56 [Bordetella phage vB_BbrP_BB8]